MLDATKLKAMKVISEDSRGWVSKSFPPNITGQKTKAFFIH